MNFLILLKGMLREDVLAVVYTVIVTTFFVYRLHGRELSKKHDEHRAYWIHFISVFILFFAIPLIILFIYGNDPRDYGLCIGNWKSGLLWVVGGWAVALVVGIFGSRMEDMKAQYPFSKQALENGGKLFRYETGYLFLYYTGWEFLFRGFLLFSLAKIDPLLGITVQLLPSVLLHINHPEGESWSAVFGGLLLGFAAYSTGSILYTWLIHAAMGIFLDTFIYLRKKGVIGNYESK